MWGDLSSNKVITDLYRVHRMTIFSTVYYPRFVYREYSMEQDNARG